MPGGTVQFTAFDGSKKGAWLFADIQGLMYTWVATTFGAMALWAVLIQSTGIDIFALGPLLAPTLRDWFGPNAPIWGTLLLSAVPPFLIVFVFRRNMCVTGPRRPFRYFSSWC